MCVGPLIGGFPSSSVSMINSLSVDLFPAPSKSAPPASGDSVGYCGPYASTVLTNFGRCVSCREPHCSSFQRSSFNECFQLSFLCFRYVEIAAIQITEPCSCSAHLGWSIAALIMVSHVSSGSLDSKHLATLYNKTFVVGLHHSVKLANTGSEFVELADFLPSIFMQLT